jgi:epoxyqueuosine reductase
MDLQLDSKIKGVLEGQGWDHFGWAPLSVPVSLPFYKEWLKEGLHGSMTYLENHLELKADPKKVLKNARSAIVVAAPYFPHPDKKALSPEFHSLNIAKYARGGDYHVWFKEKLEEAAEILRTYFPNEDFRTFTDSGPVLERDLAYRAGLGWVGKNTCLIHEKRGSYFFIGEILTTLEVQVGLLQEAPDRCGTCTRCIDACPTGALEEPRRLNATKCISYLNIEAKEIPKPEFRSKMKDHYFGCDICQDVCPWNKKIFKAELALPQKTTTPDVIRSLRKVLTKSNNQIQKSFKFTPLNRVSGLNHKRNAIIVATNLGLKDLLPEIRRHLKNEKLKDLVEWSLKELNCSSVDDTE